MSTVASIRPSDLLSLAGSSLRRNRLRSLLTIGAIAVGVSVMMYLISFGLGLEILTLGSVERSSSLLTLSITSGSDKLQPLDSKAVAKIKAMPKIKEVLPQLTVKGQVSLEGQSGSTTLIGADPDYLAVSDESKLKVGRYYQPDDQQTMVVTSGFLKLFGLDENKTPLVVFSAQLDKTDYPDAPPLTNLNVSGVVDSEAVIAYLPLPYLEHTVGDPLPPFTNLKATVASTNDIEPASDQLIANGFRVSKVVDTVDEIKKVFFWIRAVMSALGLIAIFVATIGMFNTLTVSLLERTKEIGIMKALGVKKSDVRRLFLTESLLMGLCGGGAGIGLAIFFEQITLFLLSLLASLSPTGTVPSIFSNPWYLVLGFILFSLLIAMLTGIYPARRAARISPLEAIRYE